MPNLPFNSLSLSQRIICHASNTTRKFNPKHNFFCYQQFVHKNNRHLFCDRAITPRWGICCGFKKQNADLRHGSIFPTLLPNLGLGYVTDFHDISVAEEVGLFKT